jgi:hypothetical protein
MVSIKLYVIADGMPKNLRLAGLRLKTTKKLKAHSQYQLIAEKHMVS